MIDGEFLARLVGNAIVRATCIEPGESVVETDDDITCHALTRSVERLRSRAERAEAELAEQRESAAARVDRLADEWRVETARLQAEVSRLRARVQVEAEDVERVGLVDAAALRYVFARGWTPGHRYRRSGVGLVIVCADNEPISTLAEFDDEACSAGSIAFIVGTLARKLSRSPWTVLEEMAATTPTEPARES
jgi:hypothetical protein